MRAIRDWTNVSAEQKGLDAKWISSEFQPPESLHSLSLLCIISLFFCLHSVVVTLLPADELEH